MYLKLHHAVYRDDDFSNWWWESSSLFFRIAKKPDPKWSRLKRFDFRWYRMIWRWDAYSESCFQFMWFEFGLRTDGDWVPSPEDFG